MEKMVVGTFVREAVPLLRSYEFPRRTIKAVATRTLCVNSQGFDYNEPQSPPVNFRSILNHCVVLDVDMITSKRQASFAVTFAVSISVWLPSVLHAAPQPLLTMAPGHTSLRSSYAYNPSGQHGHARLKIHTRPRQSGYYSFPAFGFGVPYVSGYWAGTLSRLSSNWSLCWILRFGSRLLRTVGLPIAIP